MRNHEKLINKQNMNKIIKTSKKVNKFKMQTYQFHLLNEQMLTNNLISQSISKFWEEKIIGKKVMLENKHLILSYRASGAVQRACSDSTIFTLGQMIRVNITKESLDYIINKVQTILALKDDGYKNKGLNSIILHYGFVEGKAPIDNRIVETSNMHQNYRHYKLPITLDPLKYGTCVFKEVQDKGNFYILQSNTGNLFKILQYVDSVTGLLNNNVELIRNGISGLIYNDQEISKSIFTRSIGANKYYCNEEKGVEFFHSVKQNKYIKTLNKETQINQDIITLDLETYVDHVSRTCPAKAGLGTVRLIPYLISFYDGVDFTSNYITDFSSHQEMILDCLNKLVIDKYDGYKVYAHNLSNFDSIFMLDILNKHFNINIIRNKGRIISIKISKTITDKLLKKEKVIKLTFYDSYQLLPSALRKLAIAFNTNTQKDIFPHNFVNKNNLNYIGAVRYRNQWIYFQKVLFLV